MEHSNDPSGAIFVFRCEKVSKEIEFIYCFNHRSNVDSSTLQTQKIENNIKTKLLTVTVRYNENDARYLITNTF